jgi:hypothetical protein
VSDSHHPITHHGGDQRKIANVAKINVYHASLFSYYLDKLRTTKDGDASLLDNIVVLYGSGISDGDKHQYRDVPIVLAGGAQGRLKGGRHIKYEKSTLLANLQLTLLHMLGVNADTLGNSPLTIAPLQGLL